MRLLYLIFFSSILSACSTAVNLDYDKSINFTLLNTYQIDPKPVRVSSDTRINSAFMQQRVVDALKAQLTIKGFKNLKHNAELEIKYYLDINHEMEVHDSGAVSIGFGSSGHGSAIGFGFNLPMGEPSSIDILVLTVDIISRKTNKLIWRGSLGYTLYEGATPESYDKLINDLVVEIINNFPPK